MTVTPVKRGSFSPSELPEGALVLLVGTAGSGKSTLARAAFRDTQILSSDRIRAWISDDEGDQSVSAQAFEVLRLLARRRLELGKTTVVDATNVTRESRAELLSLAHDAGRPALAVILDVDIEECVRRDSLRTDRRVGRDVIEAQRKALDISLGEILGEGFDEVHLLGQSDIDRVSDIAQNSDG